MSVIEVRDDLDASLELLMRLNNSPLALIEWDSEFRVVRWSPRAEQLFGWSREEVLGRHPSDWRFVFEQDGPRIGETISKLSSGEWQSRIEHNRNYTKDGRIIDCCWYNTIQLAQPSDTRPKSVFSLVLDETESVRMARQLKKQTQCIEFALEASRMGCWEWDIESNHLRFSKQMEEIFGFALESFGGNLHEALAYVHEADRERVSVKLKQAVDNHTDYSDEFRIQRPSGDVRWLHCRGRATSREAESGTGTGSGFGCGSSASAMVLSGTAVDVTDRRLAEEQLRRAKEIAESSSLRKSTFLANMSHEIRTPLGVIMGFAELLADPDLDAQDRAEYMAVIARNGQHLSRLIDDILDLSKVEAGKLEIHPSHFSLRVILDDILANLQTTAFEKNVKLDILYDEAASPVPDVIQCDAVRFKQVVGNLASNALKFTESGSVQILVSYDPHKDSVDTGCLRLGIHDTGIGISVDGQKRLFEPFVQVDRATTRQFGGTGLGLALSRKIARSMGGDIRLLESSAARGTTFEFAVPVTVTGLKREVELTFLKRTQNTNASIVEMPFMVRDSLRGMVILLAEDSFDNQVLIERIMSKTGAQIIMAANGEEAIRVATERNVDLVLMDIQMPSVDGYEATRRLRVAGFVRPVIALTAHAMKEERQKCLDAGCDDHLSKPVRPADLVQTILRHCQRPAT